MNILLCAATQMESYDVLSRFHSIEILITGAGSPSTSFQLGKRLSLRLPDLAIQIGIAGAFDPALVKGSVVQVFEDSFADLGAQDAEGNFIPIDQLVNQDIPFGGGVLRPPRLINAGSHPPIKAITVNKVHGYLPDIRRIRETLNPGIETMEGAAFFACCMAFDIPCCQLRAVSNLVEPRNRSAWDIPLALKNLHSALQDMIDHLPE
jgi:futalosine hydrolase